MKALLDKYSNFGLHSFDVQINNENTSEKGVLVKKIVVNTSTDKADVCVVSFFKIFDFATNSIKLKDQLFSLGNSIVIKAGYGDSKEVVFTGFVTSINYNFDDNDVEVLVGGMDSSFKMMKGVKSRSWTEKKHSDIAKEVANTYGSDLKVDNTSITYDIVEQSRMSDYHFLKWLAGKNNFEFFVSQNTVYFRELHKSKEPVINMDMNIAVINLSIEYNIGEQTGDVVTRGIDVMKKEQIEGKSSGIVSIEDGKTGESIIKKVVGSGTKEYVYLNEKTKEALDNEATAIANAKAMKLVSGSILSVGIPELMAGKYLKIKIAENFEKMFYIKATEHMLDENNYTTLVTVGGNTI